MARRVPLIAACVALVPALLVLGPILMTALHGGGLTGLRGSDLQALWFTLWQAAASALISCVLAVPLARALARRRFIGRSVLITALGAPFILPVIAAILGLLAVFGRSGLLNQALGALGLPTMTIYGAHGVILAHVFFNLPLATRMVLQGWQAIPAERLRLAMMLDFDGPARRRHIETPMLRATLPGAFIAIFLVCLGSFAVALTLGGGPSATTVELAIYQAFRFDYDTGRAASLALVQVALCVLAVGIGAKISAPTGFGAGLDRPTLYGPSSLWQRSGDAAIIVLAALFLLLPIGLILWRGLPAFPALPLMVWKAAATSLTIALGSTVLALALALPLALAAPRHRWAEGSAMLPLAASGLVLGTGLFLLIQPFAAPTSLLVPVTLVVNATLSLPFITRLLLPEIQSLQADYDRLATSLDLSGWAKLRRLTLPRLARPLGFSAGLACAFSMGDLGVITLFSDGQTRTLPLAIFQLMGSYRLDQAAAAATLLLTLTFGLFALFDRIGHHADPR
ncbi:thiamine/thiamine pyrophosphate ABC transporter permease ThiP [Thioclava sp. GXIMD4216]|uniref:Thiamine/thiamine pyrophosphate ABC transporter permease ThiP n=1 Tax=Thioclava litoralis TaxID=3076557 RepID=A0ABZ1E1F7_9RHOB|nr:thiamine/thiamine pyrophosphate ABC transporter permease ThiP [Thioclava sp. FTW29]